jgi:uncharacterized repeat protein (TIGR01451 family)
VQAPTPFDESRPLHRRASRVTVASEAVTVQKLKGLLLAATIVALAFPSVVSGQAATDLSVTKTGPAETTVGGNVAYTVVLTNVSSTDAATVSLSDPTPAGMVFQSAAQDSGTPFVCTDPGVGNQGTVNCTAALLPAGGSASFTFTFTIAAGSVPGNSYTNIATATTQSTETNTSNNSDEATTEIPYADLSVVKSGPDQAAAGSQVSYMVVVTNNGPDAADSVTLNDPFPAGMTFVSATQDSGPVFNCPAPGPTGPVTCTLASMPAGATASFTFVFEIPAQTAPGTQFTNVATVSSPTDPSEENNSSVVVMSTPPPPRADLSVMKTAPNSAGPGTNVVYTITLANGGPDAAEDADVSDTLPGTMTFVSVSQTGTPLTCTTPAVGAGGTISCSSVSYPAGGSTTITLTGNIPGNTASGTEFTNTVTATTKTEDLTEENNVSTVTTIVSAVDLTISKNAPFLVNAGTVLTYGIIVANQGPDSATLVQWTDVLPAGTTFDSLTQNNGPTASCQTPPVDATGTVSCSLVLGSGQSAEFMLAVRIGDAGEYITNTATVTSGNEYDTDSSNNSASAQTTINPVSDLGVTKSGPATVVAGTDLTYTITATNAGPSTAFNVSLADTLPAGTTFVSVTQTGGPVFNCVDPGVGNSGVVTCTRNPFAPDASATFSLVVRVPSSALAGAVLTNGVTFDSWVEDPNTSNDSDSEQTTVVAQADLGVVKTGPGGVLSGSTITYTITATNAGPSDAASVTLADVVPANTTFTSFTQNSGPVFACVPPAVGGTGPITCTLASFAAGSTATFTLVVQTAAGIADGTIITNTATIDTTSTDPNPANDASTTNTTVAAEADLNLVKTGSSAFRPGTQTSYTLTLTNNGPAAAQNVVLTDTLPAQTTFVSFSQDSGPVFNCTTPAVGATGTVTCTLASMPSGTTATFTLLVAISPNAENPIVNTASATSANPDPTPGNNAAAASAGLLSEIPTVSTWGLIAMAMALGLIAVFRR